MTIYIQNIDYIVYVDCLRIDRDTVLLRSVFLLHIPSNVLVCIFERVSRFIEPNWNDIIKM